MASFSATATVAILFLCHLTHASVLPGQPNITQSTDIVAGREVVLTCSSFGADKEPSFYWINIGKNYEIITPRSYNRHGLLTWKSSIKLGFDWHDHNREVKCNVRAHNSTIGGKFAVLILNVLYEPFSVKNSSVLVHEYSHFTLVCLYYANPTPNKIYWFKSGKLFRETKHGQLGVKVTNHSHGHTTLYRCKARNDVGMSDYLQIEVIYETKRTTLELLTITDKPGQRFHARDILELLCKTRFIQPNTIIQWYLEDSLMSCHDHCTPEMSTIYYRKHPNKDGQLTSVLSLELWRRYNGMRIICLATTKDVIDSDETGSKLLAQESDVGVYTLRVSACEQGWHSIGVKCYKIFGFRKNGFIDNPLIDNIKEASEACKKSNAKLGRLRSNRVYMFVSKHLHFGSAIAIIELKQGSENKLKCNASRLDEKTIDEQTPDCFEVRCKSRTVNSWLNVPCTTTNLAWLCETNRDAPVAVTERSRCPQRWITNANMCYKLASVRNLKVGYNQMQELCYYNWAAKLGEIRNKHMLVSHWNVKNNEGVLAHVSSVEENDKDCIVLGKSFARRYRDIYGRERYTSWTPVPCSKRRSSRWLCEKSTACPSGWLKRDDSCYKNFSSVKKLTFEEASNRCKKIGATLGIVRSLRTEFNLVDSQTMGVGLHDAIMIQGSDARQEGYWEYDDGTPIKYTHWADDPTDGADKDCVVLLRKWSSFVDTLTGGKDMVWWMDTSCTDKLFKYWLCQKKSVTGVTCPLHWCMSKGMCYAVFQAIIRGVNHRQAKSECRKEGGTLGRSNELFLDLLSVTLANNNYYSGGILIQGSDKKKEGVWRYDDGTPMTYTNWGEPDNNADCVVLRKLSERRSDDKYGVENYTVWTDVPCTKRFSRWVCEKVVDDTEECQQHWTRTENSCFRIFTKPTKTKLKFEHAYKKCKSIGARLGQIRSMSTECDLVDSLKLTSGLEDAIMIQGTDGDREGYWTYDDGTPMKYTHWDNGDPLDADRRDCIVFIQKSYIGMPRIHKTDDWVSWTDVSCYDKMFRYWLCEKKPQGSACTGKGWALHGNVCYRTFYSKTETLTHGQAQASCTNENATLGQVRAHWLEMNFTRMPPYGTGFVNAIMIQGNDRKLENRWVYDDGTPMTYTNWGYLSSKQKPCALVKKRKTLQNRTGNPTEKLSRTNVPCSEASARFYLCEKPEINYVGVLKKLPTGDIHEGSNVRLACSFGATEPDKIVWKSPDISILLFNSTSRINTIFLSGKVWSHLSINRIAWWYNTVRIVCDYNAPKKTSVQAAAYTLNVKYKPRVTVDGPIVSNALSTFRCSVMANPPTTQLHWQVPAHVNDPIHTACNAKPHCVIEEVGVYGCSAYNDEGVVGAFDTVFKPKDARYWVFIEMTRPKNTTVLYKKQFENLRVRLECTANGILPQPTIIWHIRNNGKRYNLNKVKLTKQQHLKKSKVTKRSIEFDVSWWNNNASIACEVFNDHWKKQSIGVTYKLSFYYAPVFRESNSEVIGYVGRDLELTCRVQSANPPTSDVQWYKENTLVGVGSRYVKRNFQAEDSGLYVCKSRNRAGQSSLLTHVESHGRRFGFYLKLMDVRREDGWKSSAIQVDIVVDHDRRFTRSHVFTDLSAMINRSIKFNVTIDYDVRNVKGFIFRMPKEQSIWIHSAWLFDLDTMLPPTHCEIKDWLYKEDDYSVPRVIKNFGCKSNNETWTKTIRTMDGPNTRYWTITIVTVNDKYAGTSDITTGLFLYLISEFGKATIKLGNLRYYLSVTGFTPGSKHTLDFKTDELLGKLSSFEFILKTYGHFYWKPQSATLTEHNTISKPLRCAIFEPIIKRGPKNKEGHYIYGKTVNWRCKHTNKQTGG